MSRRDQIKMSDDEVLAFLDEQRTVICATNGKDGFPHLMPLWYVVRGHHPSGTDSSGTSGGGPCELWAWTFAKSQKVRNLERDPRASVQVETGSEYQELRGVLFKCEVELVRDPEQVAALGREIFARYTGADSDTLDEGVHAMVEKQAAKRVGLRFVERDRATWDHRKLAAGVY